MNRLKKIFAVGLLSVAFSSAQAAVVDFEDQAFGTYPGGLTVNGVTFQGYDVFPLLDGGLPEVIIMSEVQSGHIPPVPLLIDAEPVFPVGDNQFLTSPRAPDLSTAIMMSFDSPVSNVSFDFGHNMTDWWMGAFVADALVELGPLAPTGPGWNTYDILYSDTADISSVVFINAGMGVIGPGMEPGMEPEMEPWREDVLALDNVTFTSAVPEPSVYALMLGGLGLIGFMARRRRMQA